MRILLLLVLLFSFYSPVLAQEAKPEQGPVYLVQVGDSLWDIAARFGVSVIDLQTANGISNPNQLEVGDRLVIPGLEGIQGVINTISVEYGDTLQSLSRRYLTSIDALVKLNRLTAPGELYAGYSLVIPEPDTEIPGWSRSNLGQNQSLLELAIQNGVNPWQIVQDNQLDDPWSTIPGDILGVMTQSDQSLSAFPEQIQAVFVEPTAFLQGKAGVILVNGEPEVSMSGSFLGHELHFFSLDDRTMVALQGVHAMSEPGIYPLQITAKLPDQSEFNYTQFVRVKAVDYPYDQPLVVDPATIDPAVTKPEDAQWSALALPITPEKYWNGIFNIPSPLDSEYCLQSGDCWSSRFGNRRSYNGSPYSSFHTGLDIVGKTGTEIYAPADGKVVFAGPLTVRGNATMIDHGYGVYTGYMHQSEIFVKAGDMVKAGQLIGLVGATGRVQGPHLHWEVWVGGVQVDPLDWLERAYP